MKSKILLGVLILAIFIPIILIAAQKTLVAPTEIVLRQGPGSYFPVVGTASKGTSCTVLQESGVWYHLKISEELTGYASKKSFETKRGISLASYRFEADLGFGGRVSSTEVTAATKGLAGSPLVEKYSKNKNMDISQLEYVEKVHFTPEEFEAFSKTISLPSLSNPELSEEAYIIPSDIDLGRAIVLKFITDQGLVSDDNLMKYISMLGTHIKNSTPLYDVPFYFAVLDQDYVNSFAAPGGYILITRGCLESMENEGELAAVLAHEMAHIVKRHGLKELSRQKERVKSSKAMDDLDSMAMDKGMMPDDMAGYESLDRMTNEMFQRLIKGRLQADEFEADKYGTVFLGAAGYYPGGMVDLLKRISSTRDARYVSHPDEKVRIKNIKRTIKDSRLNKIKGLTEQERFKKNTVNSDV